MWRYDCDTDITRLYRTNASNRFWNKLPFCSLELQIISHKDCMICELHTKPNANTQTHTLFSGVSQYQNVSILDFIGARPNDNGDNADIYKMCKTQVKSSPPTNQHPVFLDRTPFLSPNQQRHSTDGKQTLTHWLTEFPASNENPHHHVHATTNKLPLIRASRHENVHMGATVCLKNTKRLTE